LVMVDRHPAANAWVHWAIVDIPAGTTLLAPGASGSLRSPARELRNTFGAIGYGGPQPPAGTGDHEYTITVYALDTERVDVSDSPSAKDFERAVDGHVLASASITGVFSR
jgi:Raf kinase inhibitor-like YbhB/YbcL family protein